MGQGIRDAVAGIALAATCAAASAEEVQKLDPVEVKAHYDNSVGSTDAASAGVITPQLIQDRPLLRPGSLLEYVPGMVVTQHSGAGKANQYFLRGFNLDHGTDFSTWVAGMPVNLRTHAPRAGLHRPQLHHSRSSSPASTTGRGRTTPNIGDFGSAGGASMHVLREHEGGRRARHRR